MAASHVRRLSVGLEPQIVEIQRQLRFLGLGSAQACFVEGEWGTGKSHLLALTAQLALDSQTPIAYLNLNGQNAALNHPQRFYHLLAARVSANRSVSGISDLIRWICADQSMRTKLLEWAMINDRTSELAWAVKTLLNPSTLDNSLSWSVLLGTDLAWADYGYKREKAIKRIADLGHCLSRCGLSGLVLELDELETLEQLWNSRSRKGAYEVLGRLIQMKHVFPVFAITSRFRSLVAQDFSSLSDFGQGALEFMNGWQRRQYPLLKSAELTQDLALTLAHLVQDIYSEAYNDANSKIKVTQIVTDWTRMPTRSPRTLLRRVIHHLDISRNGI